MCNTKKQKLVAGLKVVENKDRISELPDVLLYQILSLLQTKDAVATSVLFKRWQNLWIFVSNLEFEASGPFEDDQDEWNDFTSFVKRVLHLHSSNVEMFCLSYHGGVNKFQVLSWISAAILRQVQVLQLSYFTSELFNMPQCLFTCKTLRELKIDACNILELPPKTNCFVSLRTLHLSRATFMTNLSTNELFSGLPILEELTLDRCHWSLIKKAMIAIPTLKRLTITIGDFPKTVNRDCEVEVHAENLVYLRCDTDLSIPLLLRKLPLLVDASVKVRNLGKPTISVRNATELFRSICSVKSLKFDDFCSQDVYHILMENASLFPTFGNLTSLEVNSSLFFVEQSKVLIAIFRNSPSLESIVIEEVHRGIARTWKKNALPLISRLKTCSLRIFHARSAELSFVKFLLKTAKMLERITIYRSEYLKGNQSKLDEIMKKLNLSGGSKTHLIKWL